MRLSNSCRVETAGGAGAETSGNFTDCSGPVAGSDEMADEPDSAGDIVRVAWSTGTWSICMAASFSRRTRSNSSTRFARSVASACARPTHSNIPRTRLRMSPIVVRLPGHLIFAFFSICVSWPAPDRTATPRGKGVGSRSAKCDRWSGSDHVVGRGDGEGARSVAAAAAAAVRRVDPDGYGAESFAAGLLDAVGALGAR